MKDEADLRLPRPGQAHLVVRVHVLGVEDVAGVRGQTFAVGREKRPILPRENFKLAAAVIGEVVAHAQGVGVAGDVGVGRGKAEEVGLDVAGNGTLADGRVHAHSDA